MLLDAIFVNVKFLRFIDWVEITSQNCDAQSRTVRKNGPNVFWP